MRMTEEEKEMLSDEKPALIWHEEDLLPLKQKSQIGKQKRKGNNRLPEFERQPEYTNIYILFMRSSMLQVEVQVIHLSTNKYRFSVRFPNSKQSDAFIYVGGLRYLRKSP